MGNASKLPDFMAVTPSLQNKDIAPFIKTLEKCLQHGLRLVYFRGADMQRQQYLQLLPELQHISRQYNSILLQDGRFGITGKLALHLPSTILMRQPTKISSHTWLSAACHNVKEASKAKSIGANILLVAPVLHTASHPQTRAMGWKRLHNIASRFAIPCYALGGMDCSHLHQAKQSAAKGIALHSGLWQAQQPHRVIQDCIASAKQCAYTDIA